MGTRMRVQSLYFIYGTTINQPELALGGKSKIKLDNDFRVTVIKGTTFDFYQLDFLGYAYMPPKIDIFQSNYFGLLA